jgi:hypothetical protein
MEKESGEVEGESLCVRGYIRTSKLNLNGFCPKLTYALSPGLCNPIVA